VQRGEWERFSRGVVSNPGMGSVAYKLALVAAGKADDTWTLMHKNEWDVAAGAALLAVCARASPVAENPTRPGKVGVLRATTSFTQAHVDWL
jgi:myo-inositol-1(or 4)-monophosphatase